MNGRLETKRFSVCGRGMVWAERVWKISCLSSGIFCAFPEIVGFELCNPFLENRICVSVFLRLGVAEDRAEDVIESGVAGKGFAGIVLGRLAAIGFAALPRLVEYLAKPSGREGHHSLAIERGIAFHKFGPKFGLRHGSLVGGGLNLL